MVLVKNLKRNLECIFTFKMQIKLISLMKKIPFFSSAFFKFLEQQLNVSFTKWGDFMCKQNFCKYFFFFKSNFIHFNHD